MNIMGAYRNDDQTVFYDKKTLIVFFVKNQDQMGGVEHIANVLAANGFY